MKFDLKFKVLDAYLIKKYFSTFFFSLLICTLISVAIDFSDKVKSFIEKPCTMQEILLNYFPGFIMHMAGLLLPMYTLIAVVFSPHAWPSTPKYCPFSTPGSVSGG